MSHQEVSPNTTLIMRRTDTRQAALKRYLHADGVKAALAAVLPALAKQAGTTPELLISTALIACAKNPSLLNCTEDSILRAVLQCAELGLSPGGTTGEAHLVPYGRECQLQIGYRGFQRLAFEAGRLTKMEARVVYETEIKRGKFTFQFEPETHVTHEPELMEPLGPIVAVYAKASFRDATPQYELLRKDDLDRIRAQANRIRPSVAWKDWPDQMAIKAAIKRLCKRLDLGAQSALIRAIQLDDHAEAGESQSDLLTTMELPDMNKSTMEPAEEETFATPTETGSIKEERV